jgi:hypothetical protein
MAAADDAKRRIEDVLRNGHVEMSLSMSFRDGSNDQTRNLEIPGSMLRIAPE